MTLAQSTKVQITRLLASVTFALVIAGALGTLLFWPHRPKPIAPMAAPPTRPRLLDVPYVPAQPAVSGAPLPAAQ